MKPLTFDEWYRNARVGDFSPEGCSRAAWEAGQKQAESERDALRLRVAALEDGLREIAEMQARPFEGIPADWSDQVAACPECQQYKGHPIQHGICDSHREPLWAREKHNNHELGVGMRCRMVGIARDLLAPRGSDAACPNCGCTETLPPIPGTFGIPCAKCCG